jgi:cyclic beta-1,2-glucan synthetase
MIASKPLHGFTTDRAEFIGRSGTLESPAALKRMGLERRVSAGEDLCGVLQVHLDLLPGSEEEIYFVIGQGSDRKHTLALARKYHNPDSVASAYRATQAFWDRLLGTIQVHTPNSAMDLVLNRWMLYQALSCRIWGRSGFYQSSGAFGFRDQLQDVLAALMVDPTITKSQILNAAQHQFEEGDVLHWWHPPSGRGVRTRFSDDMLWLPYVTALYIEATKDEKILDERVPFLSSSMLKDNENERYGEYRSTLEEFSLLDHCNRAIERGLTLGVHRLPLIGTGDWNDGFNRIGKDGKGESVWMAWFLGDVLQRFATVCESKGDKLTAQHYRDKAAQYAAAVEENAWDGAWYRRAYFDNGDPLGSKDGLECQIDCIAQSWAVLSGLGNSQRCDIAMRSVKERLIRPEDRLLLLFTPPFDKAPLDPGYIKGYLPGIRENGGQYTHAAVWSAWAFAKMGEGKQAEALFDLLNPIFQADNKEKADIYRVEPFAICADIYSVPPNIRRGGWSWYTGSAAWFYRLGVEAILGMHKVGELLQIDPTIPPDWKGFEIRYRHGDATYLINVQNPEGVERGVKQVCIDDQLLIGSEIPLVKDKKEHWVDVLMGK